MSGWLERLNQHEFTIIWRCVNRGWRLLLNRGQPDVMTRFDSVAVYVQSSPNVFFYNDRII